MEELTYEQFINNIITTRGKHGCGEIYHERHHIVPKCLGGSNNSDNMIDLFAREHFIAHRLLALENPHNQGLQFAWWCMSSMENKNQERYKCTPEEYEEAKIAMAKVVSERMSGENNYWYGKHLPEEVRQKMSESRKGKQVAEETKLKISQAISGEKHWAYGKHLDKNAKEHLRKLNNGVNHPQHRPIICIETGEWFWGAKDVEEKLGINKSCICMCCKGKHETAGGLHWKYAKEVEKEN